MERGIARFEVLGLKSDRDLIRSLARRLAEDDQSAQRIRATVDRAVRAEPAKKGGILESLRRSPSVGATLDVKRAQGMGRKVNLQKARSAGKPGSDLDMIVAAVAEVNDCLLVTDNENHFPGIPILNPLGKPVRSQSPNR